MFVGWITIYIHLCWLSISFCITFLGSQRHDGSRGSQTAQSCAPARKASGLGGSARPEKPRLAESRHIWASGTGAKRSLGVLMVLIGFDDLWTKQFKKNRQKQSHSNWNVNRASRQAGRAFGHGNVPDQIRDLARTYGGVALWSSEIMEHVCMNMWCTGILNAQDCKFNREDREHVWTYNIIYIVIYMLYTV